MKSREALQGGGWSPRASQVDARLFVASGLGTRYLVRDRDRIYGGRFRRMLEVLDVEVVVTAARSPWQNAYAERLIGSLRRECLDHVVVLGEIHLLRILAGYFEYYNRRAAIFHWWVSAGTQAGARTRTRQGS